MADEPVLAKSLVEQILDDMLSRLSKRDEIDPDTLKRIKALVVNRALASPKRVEEAIRGSPRRHP